MHQSTGSQLRNSKNNQVSKSTEILKQMLLFLTKSCFDHLLNICNGKFGVILELNRSFSDRVVFQRLGPFYSHISDSCQKSHDLL